MSKPEQGSQSVLHLSNEHLDHTSWCLSQSGPSQPTEQEIKQIRPGTGQTIQQLSLIPLQKHPCSDRKCRHWRTNRAHRPPQQHEIDGCILALERATALRSDNQSGWEGREKSNLWQGRSPLFRQNGIGTNMQFKVLDQFKSRNRIQGGGKHPKSCLIFKMRPSRS